MKEEGSAESDEMWNWLTPDFYSRAYDRFIRLRWTLDPFPDKDYHLDPKSFELLPEEKEKIPVPIFGDSLVLLSSYSLTGQINGFLGDLFKLKTWEQVLPEYNEKQRLQLMDEFVEPLVIASLTAPYAVKNQIIFTAAQIAIMLERGRGKAEIPEPRFMRFRHLEAWAGTWLYFKELKLALDDIGDEGFMDSTKDFRHRYMHRLPPRIATGLVANFRFEREGKFLKYFPHFEEPLGLSDAISASVVQHRACATAFIAFWKMLRAKLESM
jgi:hypothetical protein